MLLHLGENTVVSFNDIIGIFNTETAKFSPDTNKFLRMAEEDGFVERVNNEIPKSFVVAEINKKSRIIYSPISSSTLYKRTTINDLNKDFKLEG